MKATRRSSERLASSRSLGPRLRHCRNPLRETPSTLQSRAIGCQPRLCFDPGVLHRDSLAKYAAAFFNMSLSTLAEANSRRNRSTSASSSFTDRGVAVTPLEDPSLPARSSFTQLNKLESGIPSLRLP